MHAGASTITMQLARMRYHLYTRNAAGKLKQMLLALEIERHYTKAENPRGVFQPLRLTAGTIEGVGAGERNLFRQGGVEAHAAGVGGVERDSRRARRSARSSATATTIRSMPRRAGCSTKWLPPAIGIFGARGGGPQIPRAAFHHRGACAVAQAGADHHHARPRLAADARAEDRGLCGGERAIRHQKRGGDAGRFRHDGSARAGWLGGFFRHED